VNKFEGGRGRRFSGAVIVDVRLEAVVEDYALVVVRVSSGERA